VVKAHRKKARKPLPKAKILPKRGTATIKGEKELPRDTVSHLEKQKEMKFKDIHGPALDHAPLIPQPKLPQTKEEKITPPSGGWSKQDKNRSKLTTERKQSSLVSLSKEEPKFHPVSLFRPSETIYLSSQANRIRQQILSLDTSPFTIRYKDVKNLLLEIGIPIERSGGSHAHIKTPGHNLKTIVDLHYGWTDKYGPGAMASLRTLLMNLGLDQEEYVKERREDQSS
jgi:predicted RNA binding protein YcfA (HicA-like mRNA interferase family)